MINQLAIKEIIIRSVQLSFGFTPRRRCKQFCKQITIQTEWTPLRAFATIRLRSKQRPEQRLRRDMKFIPAVLHRAAIVAEWQRSSFRRTFENWNCRKLKQPDP